MRILLTGAKGIVGVHVHQRLLEEGHEVFGLDWLNKQEDGFVKADIVFPEEVYRAFDKVKPEMTIHMAGEVGRLNGEEYPERMVRTNILGTLNIAQSCIRTGSRLVNFSTSEVYGSSFDTTEAEESADLPALGQSNVYAISKMTGESVVKHYVENYGLQACTVRPFMLYGEGETPNRFRSAMTNFVGQALRGLPITVHRGTIRAWCHYDDFVDGLELLLDVPMKRYEAYNIGNENYTTAEETAKIVCEEAGAPLSLITLVDPPKVFLSPIKRASISKMKALGYRPKVALRQGVRRVVEWQRGRASRREEDWLRSP